MPPLLNVQVEAEITKPECYCLVFDLIQAPLHHFDKEWNAPGILKSSWKRFAAKAKELNKVLKEKIG